jgi:methionyl-tRNA formyltransferase
VNLHASLLPRHRGASPIQAAILAGDTVTGVTTMRMDEGLDTGPILLQQPVPLRADDTAASLAGRLGEVGAELVLRTLELLAAGSLQPVPQDPDGATVTRLIRKEDGIIDWDQSAARIERLVRAMQPWPSAHTWRGGTRLQIWSADVLDVRAAEDALPGTVVAIEEGLPSVACGDGGLLRLRELQRPGGRRLAATELLRGFPLAPGDLLDGPPESD